MERNEQGSLARAVGRRPGLFVGVLAVFIGIVTFFSLRMTPVFEAKTVVMLGSNRPAEKYSILNTAAGLRGGVDVNNEVQLLRSRTLGDEVARQLLEQPDPPEGLSRAGSKEMTPGDWVLRRTRVRYLEGTEVVEIHAQAANAAEAARIANTCADVYVDLSRERARSEVSRVREFLSEQVELVRNRLLHSETELRDLRRRSGVASLPEETKALVEQSATFEGSLNLARADLVTHEERLRSLRQRLTSSQRALAEQIPSVTGPVINQLRGDLADRMSYREKFLAQGYDPNHTKMKELEQEIGEIKRRLTGAIAELMKESDSPSDPLSQVQDLMSQILVEEVEVEALQARVGSLDKAFEEYASKLAGVPEKSFQMGRLGSNAEADQKLLIMLLQRYEEARIEEAGLLGTAQIIDAAVPTRKPIRPDHRLNLAFGALVGSVLALFACLLADRFHRRTESSEEASRLSGLQVIGSIPPISSRDPMEFTPVAHRGLFSRARLRGSGVRLAAAGGLVSSMNAWSPVVESFRSLRVCLERRRESLPRSILVTSAGSGEGKTLCAANLALVLARGGTRVLLIDADMRRSEIHRRFGLKQTAEGGSGLPGVLAGRVELRAAIVPSMCPTLWILPTFEAPSDPHDLLVGPRFPEILQELQNYFHYVVIDTPPLLPVSDAAVLAPLAAAVVLVARHDRTEIDALLHARHLLDAAGAEVAGLVYNGDPMTPGARRYGKYYGYDRPAEQLPPVLDLPHPAGGPWTKVAGEEKPAAGKTAA